MTLQIFFCIFLATLDSSFGTADFGCGVKPQPNRQFVIGPKNDKERNIVGEWPWMSSIGFYDAQDVWNHQCGATLISPYHFLTAAHCVEGKRNWTIRIGDFDLSLPKSEQSGIDVEMKKVIIHPDRKEKSPYYDMAVIETDRVEFSDFIYPICLPSNPGKNRDDSRVDLLGWGSNSLHGKPSKTLQRVSLTMYPNSHCNATHSQKGPLENEVRNFLPELFPSHLACAGIEIGMHGACKGDSGGPLQIYDTKTYSYYQVAVVHGALRECGDPLFPGVYVRLEDPSILSFIQSAVESDWHLIVDVVNKNMELFNCKTGEQCLLDEPAPTSVQSLYKADMIGIDDTAILCSPEEEPQCHMLSAREQIWSPLPPLPAATRVRLAKVPRKGVGLFHFDSSDDPESEQLTVYLLERADGDWRKVFDTKVPRTEKLYCVVQLNETTTVLVRPPNFIAAFDWTKNEYTEQTADIHVAGAAEECGVFRDDERNPYVALKSEYGVDLMLWDATARFNGAVNVDASLEGKRDMKGVQIVPINGGKNLLFYGSPNYQNRDGRSADLDDFGPSNDIWKFNIKAKDSQTWEDCHWAKIGRMLNIPGNIQVVHIHGMDCS